MSRAPGIAACDECVRRSWLVARLAGHLERRRAERAVIRGVLALPDLTLIEMLAGARRAAITSEWQHVSPPALRARWALSGAHAVCRCDAAYPRALDDLPDPPAVLHLLGARELLDGGESCGVAMVGARRASPDGTGVARDIARGCAAAGLVVVSGMALGIDAAAHEGALDATAGTIAVLACGPEHVYPRTKRALHAAIAARGLVLSELPPGCAPYRWAFPARNRIIAALCGMTVVVEAAERSGSLITAEIALELGRTVGAVPGHVADWRSGGTNALLRDGAHVIRHARDVLDDLYGAGHEQRAEARGPGEAAARSPDPAAGLEPHLRVALAALAAGGESPAALGGDPRGIEALAELELLGLAERRPGGRYAPTSAARRGPSS